MRKTTAAQQRLFDNAVLIAATRLLFDAMREHFPCPRLDEIVTIHNGQGLLATDRDAAGEYDVYAAGGLVGRHSARLGDKPFVVVGRKGSAGKPTYAPFGGWVIDTAYYVQSNDDAQLDCKFLFYALSSLDFTNDIISTAIPGINRTSIYRYAIPLPPKNVQEACVRFLDAAAARPLGEFPSLPPLFSEQQRIVARIEELATKIEEARGLRRQAVDEANVLVYASARRLLGMVGVEITELRCWLGRDRDGIQTGPFGAQLGSHDFVDNGIPILTIGNVQYGGLELDGLKYVSEAKARQLDRYAIREGDILFARMGTVGRCCVVPKGAEGWLINYHIIRVALDELRVDPRYLHWTIRASADVENYLVEKIRGATRQGVNSEIVGSLPCRVPPLPEQRRIVAYLDGLQAKVDALKHLQAETAAELDSLLPSVLDKAFKGEL